MTKASKPTKTYGVPAKITTPSQAPRTPHPELTHEHAALPNPKLFHGQLGERGAKWK
jgi:hypothetical protein